MPSPWYQWTDKRNLTLVFFPTKVGADWAFPASGSKIIDLPWTASSRLTVVSKQAAPRSREMPTYRITAFVSTAKGRPDGSPVVDQVSVKANVWFVENMAEIATSRSSPGSVDQEVIMIKGQPGVVLKEVKQPTGGALQLRLELCVLHYVTKDGFTVLTGCAEPVAEPRNRFTEKIMLAALSSGYSDLDIVSSSGKTFPTHRFLLAAQSTVFAATFSRNSEEAKKGDYPMEDADDETVETFLKYLHGFDTPIGEIAARLIILADKYEIEDLKELCEMELIPTVNVQNAATILILAHRLNLESLKKSAVGKIGCFLDDFLWNGGLEEVRNYSAEAVDEVLHEVRRMMKKARGFREDDGPSPARARSA